MTVKKITQRLLVFRCLCLFSVLCFVLGKPALANTPQTHDVPMFHNDDGLGLLQDCQLMRAIAVGDIMEIPVTVNARSTNCLSSIKSVIQVIYSLQNSNHISTICIPSVELDWLVVLEAVVTFMENQAPEVLANESYGVWILQAIQETYPCK